MTPTPRALELAMPVRQILGDIGTLLQPPVFDPATADMVLGVAATDYALQVVITPFLAALRRQAPGIRVAVVPAREPELRTQLAQGDVHLALLTPQSTPAELHARRLFDERYVCLMRQQHPDAGRRRLSMTRFCALDHALVSHSGDRFHGITDDVLAQHGYQRRVCLSVTSFLALPEILRRSDLVAVVPERLARTAGPGLATVKPPIAIPGFTKTAAWHARTHRDPAHRWVRDLLFACSANLA